MAKDTGTEAVAGLIATTARDLERCRAKRRSLKKRIAALDAEERALKRSLKQLMTPVEPARAPDCGVMPFETQASDDADFLTHDHKGGEE